MFTDVCMHPRQYYTFENYKTSWLTWQASKEKNGEEAMIDWGGSHFLKI